LSLKLRLAALWTPPRTLRRMLDGVDVATTAALDGLLDKHVGRPAIKGTKELSAARSIEDARAAMASGHNERVKALVDAVGRDRAVEIGREALYPVGVMLGRRAKEELSVGEGRRELELAARVLYRALGIHFVLETQNDATMQMRVDRCALSSHYSEEACLVLSAADEGVVAGLNTKLSMRFEKRMTGGSQFCVACIREAGK
jgi:hypothetical protein